MTLDSVPTADFATYRVDHQIRSVVAEDRAFRVVWDDGHVSLFHYVWLRDNCACETCIDPRTREQVFETDLIPDEIGPDHVAVRDDGALRVVWTGDGHASLYHPGWLRSHCYSEAARAERRRRYDTWDSRLAGNLPSFAAGAVMADDRVLLDWLQTLWRVGVAMVRDMPDEDGMVGRIAHRVSFIRETNFGVLFEVRSEVEPSTNANTALELPPHTDLPTREVEPGFQLLHCRVNDATGGQSILVDGFHLAEVLRREHADDFAVLTAVPLDFHNTDRNSDYRCKTPAIRLNPDGSLDEIRFANFLRGPFDVPAERMEAVYRAWKRYAQLSKEPCYQVRFRLAPGDLLVFDNRRVLHARQAFDPTSGARRLQGCYMDRDELLSRIRVLERVLS